MFGVFAIDEILRYIEEAPSLLPHFMPPCRQVSKQSIGIVLSFVINYHYCSFVFILISQDLTSCLEQRMIKHPRWLKRFETFSFFSFLFASTKTWPFFLFHTSGTYRRILIRLADSDLPCHEGMERGEGKVWTQV